MHSDTETEQEGSTARPFIGQGGLPAKGIVQTKVASKTERVGTGLRVTARTECTEQDESESNEWSEGRLERAEGEDRRRREEK